MMLWRMGQHADKVVRVKSNGLYAFVGIPLSSLIRSSSIMVWLPDYPEAQLRWTRFESASRLEGYGSVGMQCFAHNINRLTIWYAISSFFTIRFFISTSTAYCPLLFPVPSSDFIHLLKQASPDYGDQFFVSS
jgi:hypothetical protein